jgi:hypothetical protein
MTVGEMLQVTGARNEMGGIKLYPALGLISHQNIKAVTLPKSQYYFVSRAFSFPIFGGRWIW